MIHACPLATSQHVLISSSRYNLWFFDHFTANMAITKPLKTIRPIVNKKSNIILITNICVFLLHKLLKSQYELIVGLPYVFEIFRPKLKL